MYCNQREYILSLEIHRDGLYSPWGFRLKGGIDVDGGTPLEIVKVRQKKKIICFLTERLYAVYTLYMHLVVSSCNQDKRFIFLVTHILACN